MATNISYILIQKSMFFETFLNYLQTVSIEYQKRLKKVGILRVKDKVRMKELKKNPPHMLIQDHTLINFG